MTPNPGSEPGAASHFQSEESDALLPTMRSGVRAAGSASGRATVEVMAAFSCGRGLAINSFCSRQLKMASTQSVTTAPVISLSDSGRSLSVAMVCRGHKW